MEGSIEGDFCFGQCIGSAFGGLVVSPISEEKKDPEEEAWNATIRANVSSAYQEYLNAYPNGRFKNAAQIAITSENKNNTKTNLPIGSRQTLYEVKPGDTLLKIAVDVGQSWRDIAKWNNISNPNISITGQFLIIAPPSESEDKSINSPASLIANKTDISLQPQSGLKFIWPAQGKVISYYDVDKNKGLDISGLAGDKVIASASGKVVYSGAGLRGFGNLIIIKHDDKHLTAYAHNKTLFVKENQVVTVGEKIAEMGGTDSKEVKLHFEIRVNGKPIDPLPYLGSQVQ